MKPEKNRRTFRCVLFGCKWEKKYFALTASLLKWFECKRCGRRLE